MATEPGGYVEANESGGRRALPDRAVLEAAGPDRQKFLQAMLSNEVLALKPGEGCASAFMDVKGHVQALLRVSVVPNAVHLELSRGSGWSRCSTTLEHFKVAAPVRFQARGPVGHGAPRPWRGSRPEGSAEREPPSDAPEAHHETAVGGRKVRVVRARDLPVAGFILHCRIGRRRGGARRA